jgi:hypothetical protein
MSNFYIVQKNGMPAIWQVDPQGIIRLLKRKSKAGFTTATKAPAKSRPSDGATACDGVDLLTLRVRARGGTSTRDNDQLPAR